uniref:Uncharacterized protein n=1 Tax=Brassica campestris TaxID=3711 RepID=A0A3P6BMD5_BRACM|nr:unnamed protein product [Brassica rapa]
MEPPLFLHRIPLQRRRLRTRWAVLLLLLRHRRNRSLEGTNTCGRSSSPSISPSEVTFSLGLRRRT